MKLSNRLLSVLQTFKTKEDPLVQVLINIGFQKIGFFSLMMNPQFRKVLKATKYQDRFIAVLSQFGDTKAGLGVTIYVRESEVAEYHYGLYIVPSSAENPYCIFKHSPELLISEDFLPQDLADVILSYVASFACMYKASEYSKSKYAQSQSGVAKVS